jgi:energy-coupling factor transporter ATP-binding protein EcfA2
MTVQSSPPDNAAAPQPSPRLKRLKIHRFRNVRAGTELTFDDEWNLLLGKNGTGKTTLLRLLEAILTGELTSLGAWPLDAEYEIECGDASLRARVQWNCGVSKSAAVTVERRADFRRLLDLRIEGSLQAPDTANVSWEYEAPATDFRVRVGGTEKPQSVLSLGPTVIAFAAPYPTAVLLHLSEYKDHAATVHRNHFMRLQKVRRFDESLDLFSRIVGWSLTVHHGPTGKHANFDDPVPDNDAVFVYLNSLFNEPLDQIQKNRAARWTRQDNPILGEFEDRAGMGSISMELPLARFEVAGEEKSAGLGPCRLCATRDDGTLFFDSDFSFGQRRLFAFLHAAKAPIVLADELSNGMHRDWLDGIVTDLRGRQSFIAAQNPLLLDRIGFQNEEQMRRSFVLCREEGGQFVWENAKPDDVHEVYRAYDVGLQNLSEILWQKGLW